MVFYGGFYRLSINAMLPKISMNPKNVAAQLYGFGIYHSIISLLFGSTG